MSATQTPTIKLHDCDIHAFPENACSTCMSTINFNGLVGRCLDGYFHDPTFILSFLVKKMQQWSDDDLMTFICQRDEPNRFLLLIEAQKILDSRPDHQRFIDHQAESIATFNAILEAEKEESQAETDHELAQRLAEQWSLEDRV